MVNNFREPKACFFCESTVWTRGERARDSSESFPESEEIVAGCHRVDGS